MRLPATILWTVLLTMPAIAQGLPTIEGDGSQTQSVDIVQGAVSVTIQSSGSLSAGRDNNSAGGQLSLEINDVAVGIGSGTGNASTNPDTNAPQTDRAKTTMSNRAIGDRGGKPDDVSGTDDTLQGDSACRMPLPSPGDLAVALRQAGELVVEKADCVHPVGEITRLIASSSAATSALASANVSSARIVSITIDQNAVTFGYLE